MIAIGLNRQQRSVTLDPQRSTAGSPITAGCVEGAHGSDALLIVEGEQERAGAPHLRHGDVSCFC